MSTRYNTGNPIESTDVRDMSDNAKNLDEFSNSTETTFTDRFGVARKTLPSLISKAEQDIYYAVINAGFQPASFDFVTGGTLVGGERNKAVFNPSPTGDDNWYAWQGALPKTISPNSTPAASGGLGENAWKPVTNSVLAPTVRESIRRSYAEAGYNLVDGSFEAGGTLVNANDVLLQERTGKAYSRVDGLPFTALPNSTPDANWIDKSPAYLLARDLNNILLLGSSGSAFTFNYVMPPNNFTYNNAMFAAGAGAMANMTKGKQSIAIGPDSQGNGTITFDNISMGECSLQYVQAQTDAYSTTKRDGTRNVAIGGNASQFLTKARGTVAIGRNAGTGNVSANGLVAIGNGALGGYAVAGWDASITNFMPNNTNGDAYLVGIGHAAGATYQSSNLVAVGREAASNAKFSTGLTCIGTATGSSIEKAAAFNGKVKTTTDGSNQTYTQIGNIVTVVCPAHTAVVGGYAGLRLVTGGSAYPHYHEFPVQVTAIIDANTYQVTSPYSRTASGQATTYWFSSLVDAPRFTNGEFIGNNCGAEMVSGRQGTFIGAACAQNTLTADSVVGIGYAAWQSVSNITASVAIGGGAFQSGTNFSNSTAVGHQAGMQMQNGATPNVLTNVSCFGYRAYVSGDNQVQLGNSATTTYVYGTVQNRSDERDKTDIRNTELGIEFIMGLRPVDGRWDMREDYLEEYQVQVGVDDEAQPIFETRTRQLPKDGSKARARKHHWFIAQEVKELCDNLGVDFGGYQDHAVNGGCDVLSLGYDEFIPPTVKAVQQCWNRLDELEKRIAALE